MKTNQIKRGQETQEPKRRLYSAPAVFFGGNIGGPLAGGFMASFNAFGLGKKRAAKIIISCSILFWLLLIGLFFGLPNPDSLTFDIGLAAFAIGWFGAGLFFSRFYQKQLKEYFSDGGRKKFFVEAVAIGMLSIIITVFLINPAISLFDRRELLTVEKYPSQHSVYYSGISEQEANQLIQVLEQFGHFEARRAVMVDIFQDNEVLKIYFPETEVSWNEDDPRLAYYLGLKKHFQLTGYDNIRIFVAHYIDPTFHRRFATKEIR